MWMYEPTTPSAVTRPAFLPAVAMPFFLNISTAAFSSPFASVNAFLQSIIPAPVFSRSALTEPAVISAILLLQYITVFTEKRSLFVDERKRLRSQVEKNLSLLLLP